MALAKLLAPRFFKALAEPNRLVILLDLACCGTPRSVGEVAGCCDRDLSVVSRHLARLREAGIVQSQRRGKEVLYTVDQGLVATLRALADALEGCCSVDNGCCE